jgi:hypothetical protein
VAEKRYNTSGAFFEFAQQVLAGCCGGVIDTVFWL